MGSNKQLSVNGIGLKRKLISSAFALCGVLGFTSVQALSLGEADVQSALNQRFQAEIDLLSATADELGGLQVRLAPEEDYERAGLVRSAALRDLEFKIVRDATPTIEVKSSQLIREPLLIFLIEARWARGRLLREYAIFLDPARPESEQPQASTARISAPTAKPAPVATSPQRTTPKPKPQPAYTGALPRLPYHYGPVRNGETAMSVAEKLAAGTPITTEQMLVSLFEANPVAFSGNINALDAGYILRVPDASQIAAKDQQASAAEVTNQNAKWAADVAAGTAKIPGQTRFAAAPRAKPKPKPAPVAAPKPTAPEPAAEPEQIAEAPVENSVPASETAAEPTLSLVSPEEDSFEEVAADEDAANEAEQAAADNSEGSNDAADEDEQSLSVATEVSDEDLAADNDEQEFESAQASYSTGDQQSESPVTIELRAENARLREQLSETESLLIEIRGLLTARSDELSELKARIAQLESGAAFAAASSSGAEGTAGAGQAQAGSADSAEQSNTASGSVVSNVFNSITHIATGFGWLLLLPLLIILLLILFLLARRRNKDDEVESEFDDIEAAALSDPDNNPETQFTPSSGMEVSIGAAEEEPLEDDFADELPSELPSKEEQLVEEDDFTDELLDVEDESSDDDLLDDMADELGADDEDLFDIPLAAASVAEAEPEEEPSELEEIDLPEDEEAPAAAAEEEEGEHDDLLDFDADQYQAPPAEELPNQTEMTVTETDMDFDLGDFEISAPADTAEAAADMPSLDVDEDFDLNDFADSVEAAEIEVPDVPEEIADDAEADLAASLDEIDLGTPAIDEDISIDGDDSTSDTAQDEDDFFNELDDLISIPEAAAIAGAGAAVAVVATSDDEADEIEIPAAAEDDLMASLDSEEDLGELDADPLAALEAEEVPPAVEDEAPKPVVTKAPPQEGSEDIAAFSSGDEVSTKLDLAHAYIEMGDVDEARGLLGEVLNQGDEEQIAEAEAALKELD